jgi:hypothetical protein
MTGLVPVIHAVTLRKSFKRVTRQSLVDGRIKPGHDVTVVCVYPDKNRAGQPWVTPGHDVRNP